MRLRATEKIRDFFLKRIATLKTPNTNISVIQQSYFLKYNQLFWFLIDRHSEAATEIKITYVNTVSAYYKYQFDKYLKSVSKMANVIADNLDLIGYDENIRKGNLFNQKIVFRPNVFTLGDRNSVLNTEAGIILGNQNSENQNQKYPYEATFKSLHRLFFDNGSSEFIFSTCFFSSPGIKAKSDLALATVIFNEIFEETIKLVVSHSKQSIEQSFDAVGLLLCIRINSQNQMIMQKRKIPCFDNYINGINLLLWPRFQTVMDMHIESLKRQNASKLITLKDLTNPHYIIRRYAEFCVSIISLNQGYDDELLTNSLTRLRTEVLVLLHKMSSELTLRKTRSVFLINNFDLVLSIIGEHNGDLFDLEKIHFQELMQVKTSEYVELELDPHFGGLITFITSHEKSKVVDIDAGKFEKVTSEFNGGWKNGINAINSSVIQLFPNFQNGARILHTVLTQLLIYYKRYLEMNEVRFDKASKRSVYPIGLQAVMVEIKKFKSLV